ncbi:hypothetical protein Tco_1452868, partial [Tanacetum coccineum]
YGTVVDVFIPNRKSRLGKRFAFVRFIKVGNVDSLVENLCTLWIGRMHLHANVVRYNSHSGGLNSRVLEESQPTKDQGFPKDNLNQRVCGSILEVIDDMIKDPRPKRRLESVVKEKDALVKARDEEIGNLKAQLLLKEAEAAEAIRLRTEASKFESVEKSLQGEVEALKERNITLEKVKNDLDMKVTDLTASVAVREREVHELEASSAGLQEKVIVYEKMALHLEEKLYSHLLTTISDRRWLLTHGMELAISKCLNSIEYLSALGAAIGKAVEKGMQDGLSAGIIHGTEGRYFSNVDAYNPSAEADYISALQRLQSVNFSLLAELKSNKDASIDTLINILRLEDTLAERLGLTGLQPHVDQLMVPIHHSLDQVVVGASALSLSLDVSSSCIRKIKENIANHRSTLCDVFFPLAKPLSVIAL